MGLPSHIQISQVLDGLFLGNCLAATDEGTLLQHCIKCVVSVLEQPSRMPTAELCEKLDFWHFQFRVPDEQFDVGENELVKNVFPTISEAESAARRILVHCSGGISRSPSLMITYLIWKRQMTFQEALQCVIDQHPIANPKPWVLRSFLACLKMDLPDDYLQIYSSRDHLQNIGRN